MATIQLTLPNNEVPYDGKIISFRAPCKCNGASSITIDGKAFTMCDAYGINLSTLSSTLYSDSAFANGALITAVLDVTNSKAYLLNYGIAKYARNGATKLLTARTIDGVDFDGNAAITHFSRCSTAAAVVAKTVKLTGFTLVDGAQVVVKFIYGNTVVSPTLNVNSTGDVAINRNKMDLTKIKENSVIKFVYSDNSGWEIVGGIDTGVSVMTGADISTAGKEGLVPAAQPSERAKFLRGDGTWALPNIMTGATANGAGISGFVPAPAANYHKRFLRGDGTWATPTDTTYSEMSGADANYAGMGGLVPEPQAGDHTSFLKGDGSWSKIPYPDYQNQGELLSLSNTSDVTIEYDGYVQLYSAAVLGTGGSCMVTSLLINGHEVEFNAVPIVLPSSATVQKYYGKMFPVRKGDKIRYGIAALDCTAHGYYFYSLKA